MVGREMNELARRVMPELRSIAALVESVGGASVQSMELLEVGRAIQTALVVLSDWGAVEMAGFEWCSSTGKDGVAG